MAHTRRISIWVLSILLIVMLSSNLFAQEATEPPSEPTLSATPTLTSTVTVSPTSTSEPIVEVTDDSSIPTETRVASQTPLPLEVTAEVSPATASATIIPVATESGLQDWQLIAEDNFEAPSSSLWQRDATWQWVQIDNGFALQASSDTPIRLDALQVRDVAVEADVFLASGHVQFTVRQSDAGNYRIHLTAEGNLSLNYGETILTNIQLPLDNPPLWHNLRIEVVDNTIKVLIDGVLQLNYIDSNSLPAGIVSVQSDATSALRLDNLRAWTLDAIDEMPTLEPTLVATTGDIVVVSTSIASTAIPTEIVSESTPEVERTEAVVEVTPDIEVTAEVTPEMEVTAELTPALEVTAEVTAEIEVTSEVTEEAELLPEIPVSDVIWVYLVGDTFERPQENPFNLDSRSETVSVARGRALRANSNSRINFNTTAYSDVMIIADILIESGSFQFVVRESNAGSYRLEISAENMMTLYFRDEDLISVPLETPIAGGWHNIRLEMFDRQIRVFMDEQGVLTYVHRQTVPAGAISMYAGDVSDVQIDNVEVWIPESGDLPIPDARDEDESAASGSTELAKPGESGTSNRYNERRQPPVMFFMGTCDYTVVASDEAGLISAINTGNTFGAPYTICLENSIYTLTQVNNSGNGDNGLPTITGDIIILGNGATITRDAAIDFRFFNVEVSGSLTLENLTLSNGYSSLGEDGGAIYSEGSVTLDTITFSNNSAVDGGAISMFAGSLSVSNSTFNNNSATQDGGAIELDAGANGDISASSFSNNTAGIDGGAIQSQTATLTVGNSSFSSNSAVDDGGAIAQEIGTLVLSDSSLSNNFAGTSSGNTGGGISSTGVLTVSNTSITSDGILTNAYNGGGIYYDNSLGTLTINNGSSISNQIVANNGGGVYLGDDVVSGSSDGTFTLLDVNFNNNTANEDGGAIYNNSTANLSITDSSFTNNTVVNGEGGAFNNRGAVTVSGTSFEYNQSTNDNGGAIWNNTGATLTLINNSLRYNTSGNDGGAITSAGDLSISNSIFESNQSDDDGGAIAVEAGDVHISDSIFRYNTALDQGGAYRGYASATSYLINSCVYGNTASNISGVYSARSDFDATNNWWGSVTGPAGSGSGSGDEVNWAVIYSPFSTVTSCPIEQVAPVLSVTDANATYTENAAPVALISTVSITDSDSVNLSSATITLNNILDVGQEFLAVTPVANLSGVYDVNTGVLSISGTGSLTEYQQIIASLTYSNSSSNPDETSRNISIVVNDGVANSNIEQVSVSVVAVNNLPSLNLTSTDATYTEGDAPVDVISSTLITDIDSTTLSSASITLNTILDAGQEILSITTLGNLTANYDSLTGILSISGSGSLSEYQQVIQSLNYSNNSNNPDEAIRTMSIVVNDGVADSNVDQVNVAVIAVNSPPLLSLTGTNATYTEGDTPVAVISSALITDADSTTLTSATISLDAILDAGQEILSVTTVGNLTAGYDSVTGILSISGDGSLSEYQQAIESLSYSNSSSNPDETTRTISIVVNDSNVEQVTVAVIAVDSSPVLNLTSANVTYTEGDVPVLVLSSASITDVDSLTLTSASITLTNILDAGQEVLSVTTVGNLTANYDSVTGILSISGSGTLSEYQQVIQSLNYSNSSNNPDEAIRTISIVVNDGVTDSNIEQVSVDVVAVNNPPSLSLTSANASYTEGDAPVAVISSVSITDSDNPNLTSATISLDAILDAGQEILSVTTVGNLTASYDSATGIFSISGSGTLSEYQQVIESLSYSNISDNPDETTRMMSIMVNDGVADSNVEQVSVELVAVNNPPLLSLTSADATYTEGDVPVIVLSSASITDVDSTSICGLAVEIIAVTDNDELLAVSNSNPAITVSYDLPSHVLTASGTGTIAEYVAILESLTYENTSASPSTESRDLSIVVNDCTNTSTPYLIRVDVSGTVNAPVLNLDVGGADEPNFVTSYTEGNPQVLVGTVAITDIDSTHLSSLIVALASPLAEDILLVDIATTNLVATYSNGVLIVSGYSTLADYELVLISLTYDNTSDNPQVGTRTVNIIANDGESTSEPVTSTFTIAASNTAPVLNLDINNISRLSPNTSQEYILSNGSIFVTNVVSITDSDNVLLTGATISITGNVDGTAEILALDVSNTGIIQTQLDSNTISLTGSASLETYASVLQTLTYTHSSQTANTSNDRVISIQVTDGDLESEVVTSTISLFDNFEDVICITWDSNTAEGWVSPTGGVVWGTLGMSADGSVSPVEAIYEQLGVGAWSIIIDTLGVGEYEVLAGTDSATLSVIEASQEGRYYTDGSVISIRWDTNTLIFDSVCYSPIDNVDLSVTHLDTSAIDTDFSSLNLSGTFSANISNTGTADVTDTFDILFFDDVNSNRVYDPEIDTILGESTQNGIDAGQTLTITADASGMVQFAGDLVYVYVDSARQIEEVDEANNLFWAQCEIGE